MKTRITGHQRIGKIASRGDKKSTRGLLDLASSLWGYQLVAWWPQGDIDAQRRQRLLKDATPVGLGDLSTSWRDLTGKQRQWLQLVGVTGRLAKLATQRTSMQNLIPSFDDWEPGDPAELFHTYGGVRESGPLAWYYTLGWNGVQVGLLMDSRLHGDALRSQLWEAILFHRFGFVPAWCGYKRHWYFRPQVGRRPEACTLHQKAARQARWRKQPARELRRILEKKRG